MPDPQLFDSLPARLYAICALLLVLKMMGLALYTSSLRMRRSVYASPEDYAFQGKAASGRSDPDVERARRAHRNDLENVLPFLVVGPLYVLLGPSPAGAWLCFVGFTAARILHTLFYLRRAMPHRTLAYGAGFAITLWMVLSSGWALVR
jgi:prostaglandin-E synthase 1